MLEDRLILFGEWLYARHSVHYRRLAALFLRVRHLRQAAGSVPVAGLETGNPRRDRNLAPYPSSIAVRRSHEQLIELIGPSRFDSAFENPLTGRTDNLMEGLYLRTEAEGRVTATSQAGAPGIRGTSQAKRTLAAPSAGAEPVDRDSGDLVMKNWAEVQLASTEQILAWARGQPWATGDGRLPARRPVARRGRRVDPHAHGDRSDRTVARMAVARPEFAARTVVHRIVARFRKAGDHAHRGDHRANAIAQARHRRRGRLDEACFAILAVSSTSREDRGPCSLSWSTGVRAGKARTRARGDQALVARRTIGLLYLFALADSRGRRTATRVARKRTSTCGNWSQTKTSASISRIASRMTTRGFCSIAMRSRVSTMCRVRIIRARSR